MFLKKHVQEYLGVQVSEKAGVKILTKVDGISRSAASRSTESKLGNWSASFQAARSCKLLMLNIFVASKNTLYNFCKPKQTIDKVSYLRCVAAAEGVSEGELDGLAPELDGLAPPHLLNLELPPDGTLLYCHLYSNT